MESPPKYLHLYYIHPAWSDQAGQCRIYYRLSHEDLRFHVREHIRDNPQQWSEVGLMNSMGEAVCLSAPPVVRQEMHDSQPMMAGSVFSYTEEEHSK